jgi:hypothetical protein
MRLQATIQVYAIGGPGSGCNPEVGHCGRPPGSGKTQEMLNFYHGTVLPSAKKIFAEGLKQDSSQKFLVDHLGTVGRSPNGYVFMTPHEALAKSYAEFRSEYATAKIGDEVVMWRPDGPATMTKNSSADYRTGDPAVVKLSIPKDEVMKLYEAKKFAPDRADPEGWRAKGIIPKEYISGVEVYRNGVWTDMQPQDLAAAMARVPVYLVYYGDLKALKLHLNGGPK